MNKDLHHIDDIFNSAQQQFEEDPSDEVWEKINAHLEKKDAASYKKRFILWKRTAILLLLLLTGFVLYESGILKQETGSASQNNTNQKINPSFNSSENNKPGSKLDVVVINGSTLNDQDQKNITNPNAAGLSFEKNQPGKKEIIQKNKPEWSVFSSTPDKNKKFSPTEDLQENKLGLNLLKPDNNISRTATGLFKTIIISQLPHVKDPGLKKTVADNNQKKKNNGNGLYWALSFFYSYDLMNYRLDNDLSAIKKIKQSEAHEPSFSTGLLLTRQFKKGWGLQSGFVYSNTQIGISPQKLYALQESTGDVAYKYITSSGYAFIKPAFGSPPVVGDSLTTTQAKHTLQFLSVPLVIKHSFGKKKLTINPGAGVEANFLTSAKVETEITDASNLENVTINKLKGERSFYWSVAANADIQYQVNKKIAVSLRPSFRYAISPITKNNVVETFPYSFGLGATIKIKL